MGSSDDICRPPVSTTLEVDGNDGQRRKEKDMHICHQWPTSHEEMFDAGVIYFKMLAKGVL